MSANRLMAKALEEVEQTLQPLRPLARIVASSGYYLHRLAFGGAFYGHISPTKMVKNLAKSPVWQKVLLGPLQALIFPMASAAFMGEVLFLEAYKKRNEAQSPREGWKVFAKEVFGMQVGSLMGFDMGPSLFETMGVFRKLSMSSVRIPLLNQVMQLPGLMLKAPFKLLPIPWVKDLAFKAGNNLQNNMGHMSTATWRGISNNLGSMATINYAIEHGGDAVSERLFDSRLAQILMPDTAATSTPVNKPENTPAISEKPALAKSPAQQKESAAVAVGATPKSVPVSQNSVTSAPAPVAPMLKPVQQFKPIVAPNTLNPATAQAFNSPLAANTAAGRLLMGQPARGIFLDPRHDMPAP
ncbi:MAG: hypothetical protein VKJ06_05070 [Vampirovibrionales bacterium]|nr:hypothetical protein [Vampirovibrionales bacterium]